MQDLFKAHNGELRDSNLIPPQYRLSALTTTPCSPTPWKGRGNICKGWQKNSRGKFANYRFFHFSRLWPLYHSLTGSLWPQRKNYIAFFRHQTILNCFWNSCFVSRWQLEVFLARINKQTWGMCGCELGTLIALNEESVHESTGTRGASTFVASAAALLPGGRASGAHTVLRWRRWLLLLQEVHTLVEVVVGVSGRLPQSEAFCGRLAHSVHLKQD